MSNSRLMKKFEIVVGTPHLNHLIELLEKSGVRGYTIIKNIGDLEVDDVRHPDDVFLAEENVVVILACQEDLARRVLNELHPAMRGFDGMCLISDCYI
ncbi:transcriptional regulator [Nitrosomonas sp. JL21]|uniref:P-II family nitrogen regulator n=1 Tax=Nitrosomonas sp. JL21 TaxID=153949 RepID=UPI00136818B3|nr:transcriptional regulator [Nitrosomonas sp. JL21]MBL8496823.1 transcriptional regulator [Nitrosomonas sp.]MBL8498425.1 transcriptional regulator [Nitrosomonas sp.]MCC7092008.1 transcriptional regulator [Nitrosomonas sp.]MXS77596.1 transcriptional regulator [Nitrosomonas sp. JL21]